MLARATPVAMVADPARWTAASRSILSVADGRAGLIREQVEMGVAVRMAVLEALARNLPNG